MEKSSKKRKIEIIRGIGFQETFDNKGKKILKPDFGKDIDKISIESENSADYNLSKAYLKDLKVEIIGTEGNSETLLNFIKNI
ncbi:hypothetical protein HUU51_05065 [Candidatus Gracilibacteria bacterium]|nr:hypothetical protein [Candidatus Gracilibacteria bacterium]